MNIIIEPIADPICVKTPQMKSALCPFETFRNVCAMHAFAYENKLVKHIHTITIKTFPLTLFTNGGLGL